MSAVLKYRPNWDRIRGHYKHHAMAIHQAGRHSWGIDPYAWDSDAGIEMTPIEAALWADIRAVGAVFYPQFPVGRRFVDFGNPCAKVAIECDGAQWHTDAEADAARQAEIESIGWTVYRVTGKVCKTDDSVSVDLDGKHRPQLGEAYRRIKEISEAHRIRLWSRN